MVIINKYISTNIFKIHFMYVQWKLFIKAYSIEYLYKIQPFTSDRANIAIWRWNSYFSNK